DEQGLNDKDPRMFIIKNPSPTPTPSGTALQKAVKNPVTNGTKLVQCAEKKHWAKEAIGFIMEKEKISMKGEI
ncbi:MAG: hypothetical protein GY915_07205, partial [bacterium]|nr:hypothetical protein [bacterium]